MTIEEKRQAIENYCNNKVEGCYNCPLTDVPGECDSDDLDSTIIERNYNLLFGNIPAEDPIKPNYYNDTKITPFDVIDDWELNFYLGNAIKYIKRAGKKEGNSRLQDLKKIREYIEHEIHDEEGVI